MVDQDLLTVFVALTVLAVVIQTGILAGIYLVSSKLTKHAERAVEGTRSLFGPMQTVVENLKAASARIAEMGARTRGEMRDIERSLDKTYNYLHEWLDQRRNRLIREA
jgi:hypothetical protein